MSRLLEVADLCSRTVSDPANRLLKRTDSEGSSSVAEKKSSAVPLFRSGRRSPIFAGLSSKGKVGVQRGRETAGVPSFLPPRRAPHSPALRRAHPPLRFSGKLSAPSGRTRLRQFERPAGSVQRKEPPGQGEHADAVRMPRSTGAEKAAAPFERTACAVRASQRVGAGIACVAVKPPQLHINYVCVTPTYTV